MTLTRITAILALAGLAACGPGVQTTTDEFRPGGSDLPNAYVPRGFPGPEDD